MFRLPNNQSIDTDEVAVAMEDGDLSNQYFLDTETGEVVRIAEMFQDEEGIARTYEELEQAAERYVEIPRILKQKFYQWMQGFVKEVILPENPQLATFLRIALEGKGAFRRFKDILEQSEEEWIHAWYQWKADSVYEEIEEWLATLPIAIKEEEDFFDDCPTCSEIKSIPHKTRFTQLQNMFREGRGA